MTSHNIQKTRELGQIIVLLFQAIVEMVIVKVVMPQTSAWVATSPATAIRALSWTAGCRRFREPGVYMFLCSFCEQFADTVIFPRYNNQAVLHMFVETTNPCKNRAEQSTQTWLVKFPKLTVTDSAGSFYFVPPATVHPQARLRKLGIAESQFLGKNPMWSLGTQPFEIKSLLGSKPQLAAP